MDLVAGGAPMARVLRGHIVWLGTGSLLGAAAMVFLARGRWLIGLGVLALALISLAWYLVPGRKLAFALLAIGLSTTGTFGAVAGLDLYMHHRYADNGGYNVWGYRGETLGRKSPGEHRVEMLGGSVAFGYGVGVNETIPAYLQAGLNANRAKSGGRVVVANLGWNSEGAHSFEYTLKDYAYLRADIAILYSGYNDLGFNSQVFRHQSAMFRATGYLPLLPVVPLTEWLRRRTLGTPTDQGKVVFTPQRADRYATEVADAALRVSQALERQLGRFVPDDVARAEPHAPGDWRYYLDSIRTAVSIALGQGQQVFVVSEPWISDTHVEQQEAVAEMVRTEFGREPRVHYLNAGLMIDLHDRAMCFDGMHLTAAGNRFVADWLAPEIAEALR